MKGLVRIVYPTPLAFFICKACGILPPHAVMQTFDQRRKVWVSGAVQL